MDIKWAAHLRLPDHIGETHGDYNKGSVITK